MTLGPRPTRQAWAALVLALATGIVATACFANAGREVPPLERRAQQLNEVIICPVCPGESIDQSQNELAGQMRDIVVEQLEAGWTEEQVRAFFVERYGPSVLMEPPQRGFGMTAWLLPPALLLGAALALFLALRMMQGTPATQSAGSGGTGELTDAERNAYFSRIEAALERDTNAFPPASGEDARRSPSEGGELDS